MKYIIAFFCAVLLVVMIAAGGLVFGFYHYGRSLPDYRQLANYDPPVMTRVHAGDGRLLAEYAVEKRIFVPVSAMPKRVIEAFLSAEDKSFYTHPGVDVMGVIRAVLVNLENMGSERRPVGASTITQQVAKNFLLTNEVSFARKVKEAILAFRIEQAFSKDRILELYLNEIYLGAGSYGVAAAALNYFNKSLDELSVAETAFLAALPKAPNNYNPVRHKAAAQARRDWVIGRMEEDGYLKPEEARAASAEPLVVRTREDTQYVEGANFFAEEVRRDIAARFGEEALYKGGLSVRTTLQPRLQEISDRVLRQGLEDYDRRHGWRGPYARIDVRGADWASRLNAVEPPRVANWQTAAVLAMSDSEVTIGFANGAKGRIPLAEMQWARPWLKDQNVGARPRTPADVVAVGDVVLVEPVAPAKDAKAAPDSYALRQIPDIEGALVALDPHTGRVLAMTGGYSYARSQYNRATQAKRQPGSSFKPFVYMAGLEGGFTPSTLILDAPFVIDQGPGLPKWRPGNYTHEFYGPSTMRLGIEKSRNLMTVRLAQTVGMDKVADVAERFGVVDNLPETLSMSLGAGETTLLRLTTAYAMIDNGGRKITPSLIDRIQDRTGRTIYRHDQRPCEECRTGIEWNGQPPPQIPDTREQVADPAVAYQMVSMLQGVVDRGTGIRIKAVGKPLAGKTGTTNDSQDTWFIGFAPDLAVGVFVGFDDPKSLGKTEQGASVAVPIFRDFMAEALQGQSATPFRIPPGIRLVRVQADTGLLAQPGDRNVILEAFRPGTEPAVRGAVLSGNSETSDETTSGPSLGTGGLY